MKKNTKRLAVGTLVAAAAGYLAGILTAPKSGKETRRDIKQDAQQTYAEAEKELKKLHTELAQVLEEAKTRLGPTAGKAREELEAAIGAAKQGKDKASEILSAVRGGKAEDKDLQKAIKDAQKAVDYLKTYLRK
ncbi:MAG TPA: YtxH domain-containing protein [Candidatus Saccharimonadales bacterium]